ncbi:hypothetical protein GV794_02150 [Nocardia cyriacigeorgica]|uniref:Uncharacterized protein n=1 Tax=Nocardia cyriacigeorgica TaxID=135487 RepID=A0ABX0CD33_9NOCA|nr:hypothetical protein [Nocardia cyriacigeorgica]NEW42763.1 hypothetical protein [Nocardia cyriacigeorgica]NEW53942.1 hypothetical protein [Nocardia cyriacigeorgica]NEW54469.1 hypothetical protein [Nocardia cyriacigeorgica]
MERLTRSTVIVDPNLFTADGIRVSWSDTAGAYRVTFGPDMRAYLRAEDARALRDAIDVALIARGEAVAA